MDLGGSIPNGYVSSIAVDPGNSNIALAVLSNYNIQSLWYTTNGGSSWTDVEGNLAGAAGPSVRWAKIFYVDNVPHYFLATSVGIYFTNLLNGASTVWTQEAVSEIGNVVCVMLDWRDNDKTLAVATHGRGIFTTQIVEPLPVELSAFTAETTEQGVELKWRTESEINNYGFDIEKRTGTYVDDRWNNIGFVSGYGNTNSPKEYHHLDKAVSGGTTFYRLKQLDNDGKFEYRDVIEIFIKESPQKFALEQNYPNPFNPSTIIRYSVSEQTLVSIKIYNAAGEEVITLVNELKPKGNHDIKFDARNLSNGIYFYSLKAGEFMETKKMILIK